MPPPPPEPEDAEALSTLASIVVGLMWLVALSGVVFVPWMVMVVWEEGAAAHPFLPLPAMEPTYIVALGFVIGLVELFRIRNDHGLLRLVHCVNAYAVIVAYGVSEGLPLKLSMVVGVFGLGWMFVSSED